jgi:trans-aconitate methyltransferase
VRHGWDDDETARRYDEHTQRYRSYSERAERLVAWAGVEPGMHVVDLACGTGITTTAILRRLDSRGRVSAVDGAEALLAVARARVADSRVSWAQARGETLDAAVVQPADAVLCSAAFWQMRWPAAMTAVRGTLRAGGVFAFNLPDQFFPALFCERPRPPGPSLVDHIFAVAVQKHGFVQPGPPLPAAPRPGADLDSLRSLLDEAGLRLERWERFEQQLSTEEIVDWLRVPVFTTRMLPGLDYATRMAILDAARDEYKSTVAEISDWAQFRCVRE